MEQRNASFPKVLPVRHTNDASATKDDNAPPPAPLSPGDATLSATDDGSVPLRKRVSLQFLVPDHHVVDRTRLSVRRHSFHFPGSPTEVAKTTTRVRRHSSVMARARPSTVHAVTKVGDSFFDVFGVLGVPMITAFLCSAVLMFGQAYVQVVPSTFANLLMNTSAYDEGEFWHLEQQTDAGTTTAAAVLLAIFGFGYIVLVVYMLFFRHLAIENKAVGQLVSPQVRKKQRTLSRSEVMSPGHESTATETLEDDITVAEIAKGVFVTSVESIRSSIQSVRVQLRWQARTKRDAKDGTVAADRKSAALARKNLKRARMVYFQFSDIDGVYHAYYVSIPTPGVLSSSPLPYSASRPLTESVCACAFLCAVQSALYDLPKLAFQTMTLTTYLRKGFPIPIVAFYCTMLSTNWLISFYRFQQRSFDRALIVARLFYLYVMSQQRVVHTTAAAVVSAVGTNSVVWTLSY